MHIDPHDLSFANLVIRAEVKKLRARGVVRRDDAEDFASELMVQLLAVWDQYDQARATREAFINQVVNTRLVSILRDRRAQKRDARVEPLDGRDVGRDARVGDSADPLRIVDLKIDLKAALERLRPQDRELCEWLERDALKPVSDETGIPRRTLRDWRQRIRDVFRDAGLDEYLK